MIAAINGACAGIAVDLAGFPAEYGLAWLLPRMVAITHAAGILLSGRILLAEEMKEIGFLNDVGAAVDASKELIGTYMRRPDFAEGVRAMAERRAPRFAPPGPAELPASQP